MGISLGKTIVVTASILGSVRSSKWSNERHMRYLRNRHQDELQAAGVAPQEFRTIASRHRYQQEMPPGPYDGNNGAYGGNNGLHGVNNGPYGGNPYRGSIASEETHFSGPPGPFGAYGERQRSNEFGGYDVGKDAELKEGSFDNDGYGGNYGGGHYEDHEGEYRENGPNYVEDGGYYDGNDAISLDVLDFGDRLSSMVISEQGIIHLMNVLQDRLDEEYN